jgi:hypothetical protein
MSGNYGVFQLLQILQQLPQTEKHTLLRILILTLSFPSAIVSNR